MLQWCLDFLAERSRLRSGSEWREESTPQFEFSFLELCQLKLLKLPGYSCPINFFSEHSPRKQEMRGSMSFAFRASLLLLALSLILVHSAPAQPQSSSSDSKAPPLIPRS